MLQQKSPVVLKAFCHCDFLKWHCTWCPCVKLDILLTMHLQLLLPFFRLSFYSGHSSFSMYCMLFLVVSTRLHYTLPTVITVLWLPMHSVVRVANRWYRLLERVKRVTPGIYWCFSPPTAVHSGPAPVRVGAAPAPHHPVLPDCHRAVCGSVPCLRLQTPLEWRAGRPPARGSSGCVYSKSKPAHHIPGLSCAAAEGFPLRTCCFLNKTSELFWI